MNKICCKFSSYAVILNVMLVYENKNYVSEYNGKLSNISVNLAILNILRMLVTKSCNYNCCYHY